MDAEPTYERLLSLPSIRTSAERVYQAAESGSLIHFDCHPEKLDEATDFVCDVILRQYDAGQFDRILPHGRWQHFETQNVPRLEQLLEEWKGHGVCKLESSRRLVDLFLVSVLLDAGAGDVWRFEEKSTGLLIGRSEGLAVASLYAFRDGTFGQDCSGVDASGLMSLNTDQLMAAMQSSAANPLSGIQGRTELLQRLGSSLLSLANIYGPSGRPGNLVDHLMSFKTPSGTIELSTLWDCLQQLLIPVWPSGRTIYNGKPLGDAWPIRVANPDTSTFDNLIQPFHKLTQWLTYSLMVIFERQLDIQWTGTEHLTGLPEYRNGGLYVDTGVLTLKEDEMKRGLANTDGDLPAFDATEELVVEWRAMTVALLDLTLALANKRLATRTEGVAISLSLAQLLEAGTWKAGRELAASLRPSTHSSPLLILSDGTLF